ncbi:hypothetical protein KGM_201548 [Danaus plexippus plexippus]|uniref:Uncharacterized protein n=1 Tax=Danaus plexippus plexippus TaxID=278856 RepID=A0A212F369_DANPL|nr:hypothetical protein KGM_201548 [Danaus plexippus plexippus]
MFSILITSYKAMFRVYVVILNILFICQVNSKVTSKICQVKPTEKHCLIEFMAKDRWPHQERWAFDWRRQHCYEIRWADHCGLVNRDTNNFASEKECLSECAGWA